MSAFLSPNQFPLISLPRRDNGSSLRFHWIWLLLGSVAAAIFALGILARSRSTKSVTTRSATAKPLKGNKPSPPVTPTPKVIPPRDLSSVSRASTAQSKASQNINSKFSKKNPLNLNTATAGQLELLPGIGSAMAEKILAAREGKGGFKSIEDLGEVPGIGEKTMERLRPLITVQ